MIEILEKVKNGVLEMLFPAFCVGCKREGRYLCEECSVFLSEAAFICPVCEKQSFLGETHAQCISRYGLDGLVSLWEYEGVMKELVHAIKYQGIRHAVQELIEKGKEVMEGDIYRFRAFLEFLAKEGTIISFVPMHIKREKRRGFNQAEVIAQELRNPASLESRSRVSGTLRKIKDTTSQTDLTREQRLQNIRGSFCSNSDFTHKKSEFGVVLVDDVWTTGSTMRECCRVLKKAAGVQKVWGFTLARTV